MGDSHRAGHPHPFDDTDTDAEFNRNRAYAGAALETAGEQSAGSDNRADCSSSRGRDGV